jgi:ABC-2 type transport system ATP-binding protein
VAEGSARDLKQRVGGTRLDLQAAGPPAFEAVVDHLGPRAVQADRSTLTIATATDGSAASARALLDELDPDRVRIARFELRTASLDDVFMTLTGSAPSNRHAPESEPANV